MISFSRYRERAHPRLNGPKPRVMFDGSNIYVAARCWDTAPPEQWIANELRRDTTQLRQNDTFGVIFDTFHDRRNGFIFYANPLGALADQAVTDEGNPNTDWNPVWDVRTGRFDGGWTIEMAIPFKSLRYESRERPDVGHPVRRSSADERVDAPDAAPRLDRRADGRSPASRSGARSSVSICRLPAEPRDQAVRHFGGSRRIVRARRRSRTTSRPRRASTSSTASPRTSPPTSPSTPTSRRWRWTSSR